MPLYEYECDACGHRFEVIQKFSDPPVETCPKCQGNVHKLIASPAFQFKGSGWYITDYARKDAGGGAGRSKEESKKEESKSDSSSSTTESKSGTAASGSTAKTETKPTQS